MPKFELLDASEDTDRWKTLLKCGPKEFQDIYAQPEYGGIHCSNETERFKLFVYCEGDNYWLYPFLLRSIPAVYACLLGFKAFDLETPYGYGGPVANGGDIEFIKRANLEFMRWCRASGVIAEFVRLNPLQKNQREYITGIDLMFDRRTVSLDLSGETDLRQRLKKNARSMISRSMRDGVEITPADLDKEFKQFVDIYQKTMNRVSAETFYFFDEGYFDRLRELIRASGMLVLAKLAGEIAAAAVFVKGEHWLHYHLSATNPDHFHPGATNALILYAAEIGRADGLECLHLGGGKTKDADDSLFRFKRRMATTEHDFWIGKRIHHVDAYDQIRDHWRRCNEKSAAEYKNRILCYRYFDETIGMIDHAKANYD
jgi:hypothetical protein